MSESVWFFVVSTNISLISYSYSTMMYLFPLVNSIGNILVGSAEIIPDTFLGSITATK